MGSAYIRKDLKWLVHRYLFVRYKHFSVGSVLQSVQVYSLA